jgi:integrase
MQQRAQKASHLRKFTEVMIEKLKPPPIGKDASGNPCGVVDYYDTLLPGLILRVNYGGMKVWRVRYYVKVVKDGKQRTEQRLRKLGRYPVLKLQQARDAARPFLLDARKAIREADADKVPGTFKDVAENFIKRYVDEKGLRSKREIVRCLNKYVYPNWQYLPCTEIRRGDVNKLLDDIVDKNGKRQADMVLAIISKLCNWYVTRNEDYVSPIVRGMRRSEDKNGGSERVLSDDEIRAVWKACADMGSFGSIVKVLLLTAQRRDKVALMKWDDLKDGKWIIPSEEREKGNAGTLPLPQQVIDIIKAQPRISKNPYVFAAGKGSGPFNSFSQRKAELDDKLPKMPKWRPHDLRRTARSLMSRGSLQVTPDIAERVLGHKIKGVRGIYDRHTYTNEKGKALLALAAEIDHILNPPPPNVVSMAGRKRR